MTDSALPRSGRDTLIDRLDGYWKLEAANVLLLPAVMLVLAGGRVGWLSLVALIPMMALLVIGAAYWRAKLHRLRTGRSMRPTLGWISRLQWPSLLLSVVAAILCVLAWFRPGLSTGAPDRWVATVAALLAILEYVNYYHRQLQHFDHASDWKRLRSGRGFRVSQMRQDLDRLRRGQAV